MTENDRRCRDFGKKVADLGENIADGLDMGDLMGAVNIVKGFSDVSSLLKGEYRAKALYQMGLGVSLDVGEDYMSIPDSPTPGTPPPA